MIQKIKMKEFGGKMGNKVGPKKKNLMDDDLENVYLYKKILKK